MTVLTRSQRDRLSRADVESIGRHGGYEYVMYRGHEYRLSTNPMSADFTGDPLKRDEIRISEERVRTDADGYVSRDRAVYQGSRVADGTWATLQKKAEAVKAKAARRAIPAYVDVLRGLELAQGRGGGVVALGLDPGDPITRAQFGLAMPNPTTIFAPRIEPAHTVREVMERIAKTGTVLVVQGGRLVASPPGGRWPRGVAEAVEKLEPLLVGILSGNPVPCAFRHETPTEAVTLLAPACPSCAEHAG